MKKATCVFILGNGFSQGVSFPNSKQLWRDCLVASTKTNLQGYFDECLDKYPLSYFRDNNIEDIELLLSVWSSYIENYKRFYPDCSPAQSTQGNYEAYIQNLCGHLLEYGDNAINDVSYDSFKIWLNNKMSDFEFRFVTLNYDLVLERIITEIGRKFIYLEDPGDENTIFIRKLHGSANWLKSNSSGVMREYDGWKPKILWKYEDSKYCYNINDNFSEIPYIAFERLPALIPPIFNKEYKEIFRKLLGFVSKDLIEAKYVIIVGYSLPSSDLLIRRILEDYAKSETAHCLKLAYINPDPKCCKKSKELLGDKLEVVNSQWNTEIFDKILRRGNSGDTGVNSSEKR